MVSHESAVLIQRGNICFLLIRSYPITERIASVLAIQVSALAVWSGMFEINKMNSYQLLQGFLKLYEHLLTET